MTVEIINVTPGVTGVTIEISMNGLMDTSCDDPSHFMKRFIGSLSLHYQYVYIPVSSGPRVPKPGAARVERRCGGRKSPTPHGFLCLLRSS